MARWLLLILIPVVTLIQSGITMNLHYCGEYLYSYNLYAESADCCCGDHAGEEEDDCCSNEQLVFFSDDVQQVAPQAKLSIPDLSLEFTPIPVPEVPVNDTESAGFKNPNPPPRPAPHQKIYIAYQSLILYS